MNKEVLNNGTTVYIDDTHRFGTDAMLLSHFCRLKRKESALDLCSGCGIIPLRFIDGGAQGRITALELQPEAADLISRAKSEQNIENLEVLCRDLVNFRSDRLYDVVSCNPPYFDSGDRARSDKRAINRHETIGLLEQVIKTASAVLKDRGRMCLCHRPHRLIDILYYMRSNGIEPKRIQFVRPKYGRAHYLVLVDGRKAGGVGVSILPDLIIENREGRQTRRVMDIYAGRDS